MREPLPRFPCQEAGLAGGRLTLTALSGELGVHVPSAETPAVIREVKGEWKIFLFLLLNMPFHSLSPRSSEYFIDNKLFKFYT